MLLTLFKTVDRRYAANYGLLLMWASLANAIPVMGCLISVMFQMFSQLEHTIIHYNTFYLQFCSDVILSCLCISVKSFKMESDVWVAVVAFYYILYLIFICVCFQITYWTLAFVLSNKEVENKLLKEIGQVWPDDKGRMRRQFYHNAPLIFVLYLFSMISSSNIKVTDFPIA